MFFQKKKLKTHLKTEAIEFPNTHKVINKNYAV